MVLLVGLITGPVVHGGLGDPCTNEPGRHPPCPQWVEMCWCSPTGRRYGEHVPTKEDATWQFQDAEGARRCVATSLFDREHRDFPGAEQERVRCVQQARG